MIRPALPLDLSTRELVDFCVDFLTVAGFIKVYEAEYKRIQYTSRTQKGLKSAAYESTEQLYCQYLNIGRKFLDRETFFNARRNYYRRLKGKK